MFSVVEIWVDYGGVYVLHVSLDLCVIYGIGICVDVCGVVYVAECCLLCCYVFGLCGVGIFAVSVMCTCKCYFMGNMCVSSCRCCVLVSVVHPVAILSAVFCVICSLLMFVSDASGDHMVETYLNMGLIIDLYVRVSFPFVFPMLLI